MLGFISEISHVLICFIFYHFIFYQTFKAFSLPRFNGACQYNVYSRITLLACSQSVGKIAVFWRP